MKEELDFILSYRAKFEVSSIRLELDYGYDDSHYLFYRFDLSISCGEKTSKFEVSQSASFINMEPPADEEDLYPDPDAGCWNYQDENTYSTSVGLSELTDTEKEVAKRAVELVCNSRSELKQAYKKFWTDYINGEKQSALAKLSRAENLQKKLDSFLKTIE